MNKVKIFVAGAGNRGTKYAEYALLRPDQIEIVGVAEPRDEYRDKFVKTHNIKSEYAFKDWRDAAKLDKFADAVIIATQDRDHAEPVIAFAEKNYHILLEKPMAATAEECIKIYDAVKDRDIFFGVCHVLRYTPHTKKLKEIIDSGAIGEIVNIQRLEPVGYWHYAHSYVRGNWRNEKESSFILLAKSCHDIDWIHYIMGEKCTAVSSFGSLKYFKKENQPEGASSRCLDCKYERTCQYSAKRIYLQSLADKEYDWPLSVLTTDHTEEGILKALENGPYGKCVFDCDNDVVDNQVVNMMFENGNTSSFTMTGLTEKDDSRRTTIFGTKGEIRGNENQIEVYDFLTRTSTFYDIDLSEFAGKDAHNGGDFGLMKHFINAILTNDKSLILSGAEETLDSHLLVFKAEQARLNNTVVNI
ncbi:MAG TPA: Gfo/Idh/MocA family oxidoreductase [Victivallales bacterium]|nr:Gfo/Idh/MocA family oxidoreductase [Victivallales bacterium]